MEPIAGNRSQAAEDQPLLERKARLQPLIREADNPRLQYLDHIAGSPSALWQACRQRGLEGIVSKRVDRPYRGGRAKDWLKTKHRRRDRFVIGGVERSNTAVAGMGALAVGYFDPSGRLIYCGKVGSGWSKEVGRSLLSSLESDVREKCPFDPPPEKVSRTSTGTAMRWVQPRIVVDIDFAGVTAEGNLRQASVVAIHDQLPADSVVRERVSDDVPEEDSRAGQRGRSADVADPRADQENDRDSEDLTALNSQLAELLQRVKVTSPERVLFPDCGITKLDLIIYLLQVNQWLLPHIRRRLVSLVRAPEGITGETFFQRHPGRATPPAIQSIQVPLFWEELTASLSPEQWTIRTVPERLKQLDADPWAGLSSMHQSLK